MIAVFIGVPGAGWQELARQLALQLPALEVIGFEQLRREIDPSESEAARTASEARETGALLPDELVGRLFGEIVNRGGGDFALLGYPRTVAQVHALEAETRQRVRVIHVRASAELIDERRRRHGEPPMEQVHPGGFLRVQALLRPLLTDLSRTGRLLTLEATTPDDEMLARAKAFLTMPGAADL